MLASRVLGLSLFACATWMSASRPAVAAAPPLPDIEKPEPAGGNPVIKPAVEGIAADLEALQGTWFREFTNPAGVKMRVEKKVEGEANLVTHFDAQGNVVHAHASDFELERHGPLRVFTVKGSVATAGPNMGMRQGGRRSFVYRIEGDRMIEAWGLLDADRGPPNVFVWERVRVAAAEPEQPAK
jgi:hypothetical protein